jgi:hypothetical protein
MSLEKGAKGSRTGSNVADGLVQLVLEGFLRNQRKRKRNITLRIIQLRNKTYALERRHPRRRLRMLGEACHWKEEAARLKCCQHRRERPPTTRH